ncbi:tetratricopeptide repeat protein [Nostoc sp. CHAB 5834]|nr:tetratricopeptide repeat protein [Nostoc sp. CHAB 5834]
MRSQEAERLLEQGIKLTQQQERQQAIQILQQALTIARELKDQKHEATALLALGFNYDALGEKQKALDYFNQALPLYRAVGDRSGDALILGNIGVLFQSTNRSTEAITNLQKSLQISLEMRRGLQRENRQKFLQQNDAIATTLVDVLINQKKYAEAFEWVNLFTTAELADYTRLINAKVANP